MSRKTQKQIIYVADWEMTQAALNNWFWLETLKAWKRKRKARPNRLTLLRKVLQRVIINDDGLF
jgi:hypothetical protein